MSKIKRDHVAALTYHGVSLNKQGGQLVGTCPFCDKEGHFYVNPKTAQWDCKVKGSPECSEGGNVYTFLEMWHKRCLEQDTDAEVYDQLVEGRGLPVEAFQDYQLAHDPYLDRWLIPLRNEKGHIVNLSTWRYDPDAEKNLTKTTASLERKLLNFHRLRGKGPLYLCEGEWDCIAFDWLRKRNKIRKSMDILGTPGTTFKEEWVKVIQNRPLVLMFDNDEGGRKLTDRIISLRGDLNDVKVLQWPEEFPDKADLKDIISESPRAFKRTWDDIQSMLVRVASQQKELKPIHSFPTLIKKYKEAGCFLSQTMVDSISIMLATVFSTIVPDDPVWLFVVERPSSGKTVFLEAMANSILCHFEDTLSAKNLVSGWITPGKSHEDADEDDPSILRKVHQKTLIIKDFTGVLSKSHEEQEAIFGVLRNAFDGKVNQMFANKIERRYPCHCSFLAGVTSEIYGHKTAEMGDRFLKLRLLDIDHDEVSHTKRSLDNSDKGIVIQELIAEPTERFLSREFDIKKLPKPPKWFSNRVIALARIVAYLRANVKKTRQGDVQYRPQPEMPPRLSKQFNKLGRALCFVLNKKKIDEKIYRLVCKTGWDTGYGWHRDLLEVLVARYPKLVAANDLCAWSKVAMTTMKGHLDNLITFGIVTYEQIDSGVPGRPEVGYRTTKEFVDLWAEAKLPRWRKP